jgi:taurine dioxygenase
MQQRDLTPMYGTEITGLDPRGAVEDDDLRRQLQELLDARGLLVLKGLDIDQLAQTNLARTMIDLPPIVELPEGRMGTDPFYVSNKREDGGAPFGRLLFHSDTMWSDDPIKVLCLYAVEVEQPAVPTIFASTVHGWSTLPDDLRARVDGLHATHGHDDRYPDREMDDDDVLRMTFEQAKTTTTPVAHRHPRTGQTMLYVSQQITMRIDELSSDESEALLEELFAHLYQPGFLYEHAWEDGDLAAWDNQAVQHARPNLTREGATRTLRKVFVPMPERISTEAHPRFVPAGTAAGGSS